MKLKSIGKDTWEFETKEYLCVFQRSKDDETPGYLYFIDVFSHDSDQDSGYQSSMSYAGMILNEAVEHLRFLDIPESVIFKIKESLFRIKKRGYIRIPLMHYYDEDSKQLEPYFQGMREIFEQKLEGVK